MQPLAWPVDFKACLAGQTACAQNVAFAATLLTILYGGMLCMLCMQVLSESVNWMATAVEEFGLGTIDVKILIDNMKVDLSSTNATIRNAAINLLGVAHKQLGPGLADMLSSDVKPALMTALEDTFKRNPQEQAS